MTYFHDLPGGRGVVARIRPVQPEHRGTFCCVIAHDQIPLARLFFYLNGAGLGLTRKWAGLMKRQGGGVWSRKWAWLRDRLRLGEQASEGGAKSRGVAWSGGGVKGSYIRGRG